MRKIFKSPDYFNEFVIEVDDVNKRIVSAIIDHEPAVTLKPLELLRFYSVIKFLGNDDYIFNSNDVIEINEELLVIKRKVDYIHKIYAFRNLEELWDEVGVFLANEFDFVLHDYVDEPDRHRGEPLMPPYPDYIKKNLERLKDDFTRGAIEDILEDEFLMEIYNTLWNKAFLFTYIDGEINVLCDFFSVLFQYYSPF